MRNRKQRAERLKGAPLSVFCAFPQTSGAWGVTAPSPAAEGLAPASDVPPQYVLYRSAWSKMARQLLPASAVTQT